MFLDENPDPDGVTDLKLDVDLCSIVPDSSLVPRGRAMFVVQGFSKPFVNLVCTQT